MTVLPERSHLVLLWLLRPVLFALIFIVLLLVAIGFLIGRAYSHDSPSGWDYPPECCHGTAHGGDCHPVACEELDEKRDGTVGWQTYIFKRVRPSQDKNCHVCVWHEGEPYSVPQCVFIQQGS